MPKKPRIGIYSGTFDPVHEGHVTFAKEAVTRGGLEKLYFLVEPRPRRKQGVRALEHRQRMVQLAIEDEPRLGTIILNQARFDVATTLPLLHERFQDAELVMVMGDDFLAHLPAWPHVGKLLRESSFIFGIRNLSAADAREQIRTLEQTKGVRLKYDLFDSPAAQYASSKIRLSFKRGHVPRGLKDSVLRYIQDNALYQPMT